MRTYDLEQINALAGGDDSFVKTMVDTFMEYTPVQVDQMQEALAEGDLKTVGAIAHKIKPSLEMMGVASLHQLVRDVEFNGKNETNPGELESQVKQLSRVLHTVFEELRRDFNLK